MQDVVLSLVLDIWVSEDSQEVTFSLTYLAIWLVYLIISQCWFLSTLNYDLI